MIGLIILIVIVGVILWYVNQYVPMAEPIKTLLNIIVVICLLLYALRVFGILNFPMNIKN